MEIKQRQQSIQINQSYTVSSWSRRLRKSRFTKNVVLFWRKQFDFWIFKQFRILEPTKSNNVLTFFHNTIFDCEIIFSFYTNWHNEKLPARHHKKNFKQFYMCFYVGYFRILTFVIIYIFLMCAFFFNSFAILNPHRLLWVFIFKNMCILFVFLLINNLHIP